LLKSIAPKGYSSVSPLMVLGGICSSVSGVGPRCGFTGVAHTPWAPPSPTPGAPTEFAESPQRGSSGETMVGGRGV
jgi:hypothetical protein